MKKILLAFIFMLVNAVGVLAQSTTVSGTVTDAGSQAWLNGTYSFVFQPNPQYPVGPYTWTGGTLNTTISGSLDGSGHYSVSIPSNSAITPAGSTWILTVTPNATSNSFSTARTTITGGTQTLNVTPPAIAINWSLPPGPALSAYADGEIKGTLPPGAEYFNTTSLLTRVWNGSAWNNQGSGSSGSIGSGLQGQVAIYTATGTAIGATGQSVDASAFSDTTWLARVIDAANSAACNDACTVLIPPSMASTASYPSGTLPSGVVYEFTGPGAFGVCSITSADPFFKMRNPGSALLQMDPAGSGCTALSTTAQASLQTNDHALVDSVRVNCEGQTGSSGIVFPNTARLATQYNNVTGCAVVGIKWSDSQFVSSIYDMAWANFVNYKIYNVTGGGNSNGYWHLQASNPTSGVNTIVANQQGGSPINSQGDLDFHQPEFQNAAITQLCVFGDTFGTDVHVYGGAFELGGGGASSVTIDGNTCKQASIYGNLAYIDLADQSVAEATVTPLNFIENNSFLVSTNNQGYGNASGTVFNADSASLVLFVGKNWWPNGTLEGGAGTFVGAPTAGSKYASCPGGCVTASGTLTSGYALAGAGTSVAKAENSLLLNASNTNTPAAPIAAAEFFIGRPAGGGLNSGQTTADLAIQDGLAGGGYRHWLTCQHNAAAGSDGNNCSLYLNNSTTAGGSSAPGTGNILGITITPNKITAPNALLAQAGIYNPNLLLSATAATFNFGFNTGSVTTTNGSDVIIVTVGTGTAGSTGAITLPTATTGWACNAQNRSRADHIQETATSTTSATFTNYGTTFASTNWTNSDVIQITCSGY